MGPRVWEGRLGICERHVIWICSVPDLNYTCRISYVVASSSTQIRPKYLAQAVSCAVRVKMLLQMTSVGLPRGEHGKAKPNTANLQSHAFESAHFTTEASS